MKSILVILLFLQGTTLSKSDQFQVVGPDGPLVIGAGEDVILPSSLQPNISAVDMTVEWFRLHTSDSLVHLYKDGVDRNEDQIQSYRGRTSLFKDELQKGNTSLKLFKVKVSDEGEYKCLIRSESWYDDITVQVSVETLGTQPVISLEGYSKGGGLSLLCETKGWRPEPEVVWLDSKGTRLPAEDTETLRDTESFSVRHRITVQDSNTYYCRVILGNHMKETEIVISSNIFQTWKNHVIWIAILSSVIGVILIIRIRYMIRKKEIERRQKHKEFARRRKYDVDVTLDPETAHHELVLSDDGKQVTHGDKQLDLPDNPERFDYWFSVLGKEGFSSGRFYYEVEVTGKTEWTLGVVRESIKRKGENVQNPKHGMWTMWLRNGNEYKALDDSPVPLSLKQKPQKVGVFVDYEEGVVSFYDVEANSHIYSFIGQLFGEKIYPYFNPYFNRKGENSAPLVITAVSHTI
ncbi:butyrophilin subfamily 1 member A1-like [Chanos chanos]|uniref:Butyrophilin subfamily 1 member A1-like n=1 Tax=Chanos chanos TaxID=29144 RepID=A0A6J2VSU8_CHACN|nr:butyrophilin subfamily 1 member A1-like [Chanos chanos]